MISDENVTGIKIKKQKIEEETVTDNSVEMSLVSTCQLNKTQVEIVEYVDLTEDIDNTAEIVEVIDATNPDDNTTGEIVECKYE